MQEPKNILITGASSGIGKALALEYASSGISLILFGRNEDRLQEVSEACSKKGATVTSSTITVTDSENLKRFILDMDAKTPIDLVIANAGISGGTGGLGKNEKGESEEQSRMIFKTNVDGVLNTILPIIPNMRRRKRGQIAIMSSLASFRGLPGSPAYSASKAAVRVWGEALRGDLQNDDVKVSVICPGYIKTPMTDANDFIMPFLMTVEKSARLIRIGLNKNKARIAFPFIMYFVVWLASCLSPRITDPIFSRLPKKS